MLKRDKFILPKTSNKSSCPPVITAEMPLLSAHPLSLQRWPEIGAYLSILNILCCENHNGVYMLSVCCSSLCRSSAMCVMWAVSCNVCYVGSVVQCVLCGQCRAMCVMWAVSCNVCYVGSVVQCVLCGQCRAMCVMWAVSCNVCYVGSVVQCVLCGQCRAMCVMWTVSTI